MDPLLGFSARAAALFGSLGDQASSAPTLSYAPPVAGKSNLDEGSSDDEGAGAWREGKPEPSLVPWRVVTDGETGPLGVGLMEPSSASRRAFEDEPEEDEFDFIAAGSLRKNNQEELPPRGMEVMADNAWDRKGNGRRPEPWDEGPEPVSKGKRRVTFDKSMEAGPSKSGNLARPPMSSRRGLRTRHPSYVPHHVRHPEKYTRYTLDEPLVVGGGAQGQSDPIQDVKDMREAAERSSKPIHASENEHRFVPQFGSGMEFRPKVGQKSMQEPIGAPDKWLKVSLSDDEKEIDPEDATDSAKMECVDLGTAFRHRSGGRRQYRSQNRKSEG
ncbi:hypothetical protein BSKO_12869 [Bryopsis sp. KO-2023]|nr:hypothetical protein BSKO_12869 [Bryopsis sp. KO-2023]